MGYSSRSRAYIVYNKTDKCLQESIHVSFDETNPFAKKAYDDDDEVVDLVKHNLPEPVKEVEEQVEAKQESQEVVDVEQESQDTSNQLPGRTHDDLPKTWKVSKDHPMEQIIGSPSKGVTTQSGINHVYFLSLK